MDPRMVSAERGRTMTYTQVRSPFCDVICALAR